MFDQPIRPEGSHVSSEDKKAQARAYAAQKRAAKKAEKHAMGLATGRTAPTGVVNKGGRPKSIVNRVTEYGALFNKLNEAHVEKGLPPLKTAMEVLIEAMQSDQLDLKEKAKIAEKLATFESSRAPVISIEHVQNLVKEEDVTADDALDEFLDSLRKV